LTRIGKIVGVFAIILICASLSAGDEPLLTAKVDKTALSPDDSLTLTVTITTEGTSLSGEPEIPPLEDFEIMNTYQSTNFSMLPGQVSMVRIISLVLKPRKTGALTIPAIKFKFKGKEWSTSPISVNVSAGGAPAAPTLPRTTQGLPQKGPSLPPSENITRDPFIEAVLNKTTCYVNESIIYTFRLYSKRTTWADTNLIPPSFKGFIVEEPPGNKSSRFVAIGDEPYHLEEVQYLLIPVSQGRFEIEPAKFSYLTDFFFGDRNTIKTKALEVSVLPLPDEAKPQGFSGAVGNFSATATMEKKPARVDEPLGLSVSIIGDGNLKPVAGLELPKIANTRVYPSKITEARTPELNVRKVFEYLLIPEKEGSLSIEPICLSFFDPGKGSFSRSCTQPIAFIAEASGKTGTRGGVSGPTAPDIQPISLKMDIPLRHPMSRNTFLILLFSPWILIVSVPAFRSIRILIDKDGEKAQKRRAMTEFRKGLKALSRADIAPKEFFSEAHKLLSYYMERRLGLKAGGMTHEELLRRLSELGCRENALSLLKNFLVRSDAVRFSTAELRDEDRGKTISGLLSLISELDRLP